MATTKDYIRQLDQDLVAAMETLGRARLALATLRVRVMDLEKAIRPTRPKRRKPFVKTTTSIICLKGRHEGTERPCLNGHWCACPCHTVEAKNLRRR